MTKEQRVAEALQKRQDQADAARKKMDEEKKKQMDFMSKAKERDMCMFHNFINMFLHSTLSSSVQLQSNLSTTVSHGN